MSTPPAAAAGAAASASAAISGNDLCATLLNKTVHKLTVI